MSDQPYLSVVVASRNDTHGGDPLARLQALVNSLSAQCQRFGLDAELIVVEWNPPPDRPRLRDVVHVPSPCGIALRFVEVPADLHATLPFGDGLPLFQMMAKNVGIRRARGRFVLSTNIDIICSNELVEFLAAQRLEPGRLYRVDRHDIDSAFPVEASLDAQMAFCAGHQLRVHAREGTYATTPVGRPARLDADVVDRASVTLGEGWHVREGDAQSGWCRWATDEAHLLIDRAAAGGFEIDAALELELEANPYEPASWCDLEIIERGVPLARLRISSAPAKTRFCVALEDGIPHHDVILRIRDSLTSRDSLPLFERREGLIYRLRSARLRLLPLRAAAAHEYATLGPLQVKETGTYHFTAGPVDEGTSLAVLDDAAGQALPAVVTDVYDRGAHGVLLSADLPGGDLVWLTSSNADTVRIRGSAPPSQMQPVAGLATLTAWTRVLTTRMIRALTRAQRRLRAAAAPSLRAWVGRFDPSAPVLPVPSADDRSGTMEELTAVRDFLRSHRPRQLHQNASGDFQLMAREHWFELRGFAEFPTYSMSLDGLLGAAAEYAGIREQVLEMPLCVYHLEHEKGSGWTPEGEASLRRRLAERGVTWVDHRMIHVWSAYMMWLKRPMIFNGPQWGFGDSTLPEATVRSNAVRA